MQFLNGAVCHQCIERGLIMLFTYQAIIHNDKDGVWLNFTDIEGCMTHAENIPDLLTNAKEALECYILGVLENGEKLPTPNMTIKSSKKKNETYTFIQCDVDLAKRVRSVKKTLTILAWLDKQASAKRLNFSKVLQEALVAKL